MPAFTLQSLADHTIAIDLSIHGRQVRLQGTGVLEKLPGSAAVLTIRIPDPAGHFDVVLHEGQFNGLIVADQESGCDFRISLQAADLCVPAP